MIYLHIFGFFLVVVVVVHFFTHTRGFPSYSLVAVEPDNTRNHLQRDGEFSKKWQQEQGAWRVRFNFQVSRAHQRPSVLLISSNTHSLAREDGKV